MRQVTTLFIILLIPLILFTDYLVLKMFGYEATITGVVRGFAERTPLAELAYVVIFTALYYHLFKGWLDG